MRVLDHEPQVWFLLEEEGQLFLAANCNHSFIVYIFLMKLLPEEVAEYQDKGRAYLSWLADNIQYTAPIVATSNSPYKGRDLPTEYSDRLSSAISNWRAENPAA